MSFKEIVARKSRELSQQKADEARQKAREAQEVEVQLALALATEQARREAIEADPHWQEMMEMANNHELNEALRVMWETFIPSTTEEVTREEGVIFKRKIREKVTIKPPYNKTVVADYDTSNPNQPVGHIIVRVGYDLETQSYTEVNGGIRLILTWREEAVAEKRIPYIAPGDHSYWKTARSEERGFEITGVDRNAGFAIETDELALTDNDQNRKIPDGRTDTYASGICFYSLDEILNFLATKIAKNERFFNDSNPIVPYDLVW